MQHFGSVLQVSGGRLRRTARLDSKHPARWLVRVRLGLSGALAAGALLLACGPGQPAKPPPDSVQAREPGEDAPIDDPPVPPKATGNPIESVKLWVDPKTLAKLRADAIRATRPADAAILDKIAAHPQALWLGEWNSNVFRTVEYNVRLAKQDGGVAVFVAYNIPLRDCGSHSAGGLKDKDAYRRWIRAIAAGIGEEAAVVVLEPDALGLLDKPNPTTGGPCLTPELLEERFFLLRDAIRALRKNPKTIVYLDGGHSNWMKADVAADRLKSAGVEEAHGFALNTSNYTTTESNLTFGKEVSGMLGGAHFIIDTSRNGAGPAEKAEWCNPPGRKIGKPPTTETGDPIVDAFLWLKRPGESDGECHGGPKAGVFWDERALEMAR